MYRKNTAGQFICVQLLLTASGAIATGLTPTVRRCIDGAFAAGGGTVTEDTGTGGYKYAMAQADTNGNDISLFFTATGAMPVCVNFVTTAADPTDSVRFGLTALPNAAVSGVGGLLTAPTTANVGLADLSRILGTALTETAGQIAGAFKKFFDKATPTGTINSIPDAVAGAAGGLFIAGSNAATTANITGNITGNLSGSAGSVTGAVGSVTAGVTVTTNSDKTGYALTSGERDSVADAILDRDMSTGTDSGSPTVRTVRQALRFLRNKWSIAAGTLTVCKENDVTASWTSTVGTDAAAVPIVSNDPA
jgi:hypothetical protein